MNKNDFKEALSSLKTATSVTGKQYREITVQGEKIYFIREGKVSPENILIEELFSFYSGGEDINTRKAKSFISGRVQSPAVAILNSLRKRPAYVHTQPRDGLPKNRRPQKINDETKFFKAFSEVLGKEYLISKSIGKPLTPRYLFLSNNYKDYGFPEKVEKIFEVILKDLKSSCTFSSANLSHFVDGLVNKHPLLGNRIVEFDEEQHFTPARKQTLERLQKLEVIQNSYYIPFVKICNDLNYLNDEVLPKHRIKKKFVKVPQSFERFLEWLQISGERESGYIKAKNCFEFLGGRIAQRAYYDCLRDTAHLSQKNEGLSVPLRFAKKNFEDEAGTDFSSISEKKLKQLIIVLLRNINNINLN